ncbi:hypothetical protein VST7929_01180 [Vibrio stylophorae]|uniref:Lon N-terminal domain-containing protein n=1 Tax=Vibrio stylophorae TaxID=659351 RepID=A0ABM8ZSM4_9VIBR|nr:LON peptidase substrate-binding domain-containing protein [Vibrio stylophorae]CAH0533315.1 hypothetical protein VST7929_01180 [Vibrio stylophorae]
MTRPTQYKALPLLFNRRHILPGGRMPLDILAGVQTDTMKHALDHGSPLALAMIDQENSMPSCPMASEVTIVDFLEAPAGRVRLMVQGERLLLIQNVQQTKEGILAAQCKPLPLWPEVAVERRHQKLAARLNAVFEKHPELNALYPEKNFTDLTWLCQRWLEILPLSLEEKQSLLKATTCEAASDYLLQLGQAEH